MLSTTLSKGEIERAQFLGYLSGTRGMDSTGIAVVGRGKGGKTLYATAKDTVPAPVFVGSHKHDKALDAIDRPYIYMGHARLATKGGVNLENAHPIEHKHIVMCHNGTVMSLGDKDVSDSRELAGLIASQGLHRALNRAQWGAWCITYFDLQKHNITFVRNTDRPLWFMYQQGGATLYWASEMWMLEALNATCQNVAFQEPFMLPPLKAWSFPFQMVKYKEVPIVLDKDKTTVVKAGSSIFPRNKETEKSLPWLVEEAKKPEPSVPVIQLPAPGGHKFGYKGYKGDIITVGQAMKHINKGCFNCKTKLTLQDPINWFSHEHALCTNCHDNDPIMVEYVKGKCETYVGELVRSN